MKKEISILFYIESEKKMQSNKQIEENLKELFDELSDEVELKDLKIKVKDV